MVLASLSPEENLEKDGNFLCVGVHSLYLATEHILSLFPWVYSLLDTHIIPFLQRLSSKSLI